MLGAGILPGDILIVRKDVPAANGDIVVALVDDEATVKRYRRATGGRIELHPENPAFDVIVRRAQDVSLLGKVIEVRRHLEAHLVLSDS
jgi:repressor LexA